MEVCRAWGAVHVPGDSVLLSGTLCRSLPRGLIWGDTWRCLVGGLLYTWTLLTRLPSIAPHSLVGSFSCERVSGSGFFAGRVGSQSVWRRGRGTINTGPLLSLSLSNSLAKALCRYSAETLPHLFRTSAAKQLLCRNSAAEILHSAA